MFFLILGCNDFSLCRKSDLNEGNLPAEGVASVSALLARFQIVVKCKQLEHAGASF